MDLHNQTKTKNRTSIRYVTQTGSSTTVHVDKIIKIKWMLHKQVLRPFKYQNGCFLVKQTLR